MLTREASWRARAIAVAVLCLLLVAKVAAAATTNDGGQIAFVAAGFAPPLLYAFGRPQRMLYRYRWPVLSGQAVLAFVPLALFGAQWMQGMAGLLAGMVLLLLPGRLAWPLAGLLFVADAVIRASVVGLPWAPAWSAVLWLVVVFADDGLVLVGLVRLADLVAEAQSARVQHSELAVARERLQAAEGLQAAVGERLVSVAAMAATARQALRRDPARARAQVAAAGATAREAVAQARAATADFRGPPAAEPAEPAMPAAGTVIAPRLAWAILVVLLCGFALQLANDVYLSHLSPPVTAALLAFIAAGLALQLYHSRRTLGGGRPRTWPLTLGVQTLLVYLPFVMHQGLLGGLSGFAAGPFLLFLSGRWRWAGYAAVVGSWSVLYATVPQGGLTPNPGVLDVTYAAGSVALTGLVVYGVSWLARTARQLEELRGELARMAAFQERLRVARDVHDLLGLGLSAVALKADLTGRLIGSDDARAAAELTEMNRICAQARADIRLVTDAGAQLPLDTELAAAREILASAGVSVRCDIGDGPRPTAADAVLAPVLREAVTNILRHSAATQAAIEVTATDAVLRLHVSNDGVPSPAADGGTAGRPAAGRGGGRGLGNLADRVRAVGGNLTVSEAGGRFELGATIPLNRAATPSLAAGGAAGRATGPRQDRPAGSR